MGSLIERRLATRAMLEMLADITGKPVGNGAMPMNGDLPVPPPYYVLHPISWLTYGAPLADLHESASGVWQVTAVSGPDPDRADSRGGIEQVEWLADTVTTGFLGRNPATGQWTNGLAIPGAVCISRGIDTVEAGATPEPQDAIIKYAIRLKVDLTKA